MTALPPDLLKVDCRAFGRKLAACSKGKVTRSTLEKRCEISKKIPSHSSLFYLRFAQCVAKVHGCSRPAFAKCITAAKPK